MHQKLERIVTLKNNNKFILLISCISSCFIIIVFTMGQKASDVFGQLFQIVCYFAPLIPLLFVRKGENNWLQTGNFSKELNQ